MTTFAPELPLPGDPNRDSVIAFGMPKSGSVLLQKVLHALAIEAGLTPFSLESQAWEKGFPLAKVEVQPDNIFLPKGYMYGVFRQNPHTFEIPIVRSNKVVALVRDPRDMLVSHYYSVTNSHPVPGDGGGLKKAFESKREEAAAKSIDQHCLDTAPEYLRIIRNLTKVFDSKNSRVFKYEDVIFQKRKWVRDIVRHFDWSELTQEFINEVADQNDVRPIAEDKSKHVRSVIPGDHRGKLKRETIQSLDQTFKDYMERFEYF